MSDAYGTQKRKSWMKSPVTVCLCSCWSHVLKVSSFVFLESQGYILYKFSYFLCIYLLFFLSCGLYVTSFM